MTIVNIEFNAFAKPKALAVCIAFAAFTLPTLSLAQVRENSLDIQSATRSLNQWIDVAINQDSTRSRITSQSQAMRESGIASSTLMDPKLKVGFGGLPVDSFKFDEDPMTNLSVGLMQQFERGSTLELNRRKANQQANGVSLQTQVRERDITRQITQLWLEIGYLQRAHELMAQNHRLMAEMEQFVQTNYSIGKSEAQDLLNAQLQVSKIEDKLAANVKQQQRVVAQLSEWLGMDWLAQNQSESKLVEASNQLDWTRLDERLQRYQQSGEYYPLLNQHPLAKIADINIATTQTDVELAEQSYTPQFGVEVMYAYRQSDNMRGEPTSDLLNAYVTMDIPLFTGNRQDKALSAAQYQVGASQYQKDALLAQMNAEVNALNKDRINLTQRIERYEQRLLPYANARIEAVERGYQNNTAQFGDMISATTDAIALQTEHARLVTDLNITNSKLAALVGGDQYPSSQSNAANAARNQ
jgi:outer membrane protein TolC